MQYILDKSLQMTPHVVIEPTESPKSLPNSTSVISEATINTEEVKEVVLIFWF